MKFDRLKAFPYPVLRPESDDYINAEFQATVDLAVGKDKIKANISYATSSDEIIEEIKKGNAEYAAIISCRDTYFRKFLSSPDESIQIEFDIDDLRNEVKIDPYVVVRNEIPSYRSPDINLEFGNVPFRLTAGDILAQDEPHIFYVDRDMFKPVTSLFDIVKKDNLSNGEWTLGFEEDHIQIEVSPAMKAKIDDARNTRKNKIILLNSIYFAAVMQTVQKLKTSQQEFEGRKWAEVITRQAHNKGCELENQDAYLITQKLMNHPLLQLEELFAEGINQ
jgi:hypothetical protein